MRLDLLPNVSRGIFAVAVVPAQGRAGELDISKQRSQGVAEVRYLGLRALAASTRFVCEGVAQKVLVCFIGCQL